MTEFYTDQHFHIGKVHLTNGKPCQDYALSGLYGEGAYAVLSDGCSSGGKTDTGARIIAHSTLAGVKTSTFGMDSLRLGIPEEINFWSDRKASEVAVDLGLIGEDMLATSLYTFLTPRGGLIQVRGDGVVATVFKDGHIEMSKFDWENNMPLYPIYYEDRYERFIEAQGGDRSSDPLTEEKWVYAVGGEYEREEDKMYSIEDAIYGRCIGKFLSAETVKDELEYVAIFSDGVTQLGEIDWKDAVTSLLAFKNTKGFFAKRRMIRFLKDAHKDGNDPLDDIAYAVIRVE